MRTSGTIKFHVLFIQKCLKRWDHRSKLLRPQSKYGYRPLSNLFFRDSNTFLCDWKPRTWKTSILPQLLLLLLSETHTIRRDTLNSVSNHTFYSGAELINYTKYIIWQTSRIRKLKYHKSDMKIKHESINVLNKTMSNSKKTVILRRS